MKINKILSILIVSALVLTTGAAIGQTDYVKINFQPAASAVPTGYEVDSGQVFGDQGNGFSYGWDQVVGETRDRGVDDDQRYDTLNHMQKTTGRYWEIAVPNGYYDLFIVCGDSDNTDQVNTLDVEGVIVLDPDGEGNFDEYSLTLVEVTDGRLTIAPSVPDGADNAKICFIDIMNSDLTFNPAPVADAGPNQAIYISGQAQLAGVVTDEPPIEGDPGVISYYWYQQSGPGTSTFSETDILDPTVTFDIKGVYELVLQATDGTADGNDVMQVIVKDRADEFIVGHWDFEGDTGDRSVNSNDGTLMYGAFIDSAAPIGTGALNIINIDPLDPNKPYVDLGEATELDFGTGSWTVSAWVKTTQPKGADNEGKGAIFANGADNGGGHRYTLIHNEDAQGRVTLVTDDNATKYTLATSTTELVNDDSWHFIAGVRDELGQLRVYRDGILDASRDIPMDYDLSGTSMAHSYIGAIVDNADPNKALYKYLDGMVDDVRVYNYALPMEDEPEYDSIATLAAMGPIVASIEAGPNVDFTWKPGLELQLEGSITDMGADNPMVILWTTESGPDDAEATFIDPGDPATTVSFPAAGTYILKLTVIDEDVTQDDFVTINVILPTCADVAADGLLMAVDFDANCHIDLNDLAIFAENWSRCNDPSDPDCEWPF